MEKFIVIIWSIWSIMCIILLYVETNTINRWHETTYPRDEKGRITGRKNMMFFNEMNSGIVIQTDILYYPIIFFVIFGTAFTVAYFLS